MNVVFRTYQAAVRLQAYQFYLLSSLALGAGVGFLLALLVVFSRLFDWRLESSRPDLAQVHGEVQLVGFIGLFILGMALRLLPRFTHSRLRSSELVAPTLILIVAALVSRTLVVIWLPDQLHSIGVLAVQLSLLSAGALFAVLVWRTVLGSKAASDSTAWFFLGGALLYLLHALLASFVAFYELRDDTRVFSYLPHAGRLYLLLGGFVISFLAGVGGRALPGMVGLPQSQRVARITAAALFADVSILAAGLVYLEYGTYTAGAVRLANLALACLGVIFLAIVWLTGIFRSRSNRLRPVSQPHFWLVRSAFVWLAFSGLLSLYFGAAGLAGGALPSFHAVDALRHALGIGVATLLIAGMGFLILPEFAVERQTRPDQPRRAYAVLLLLNAATLLRVISSLAASELGTDSRLAFQAAAGITAEVAVVIYVYAFLTLARIGQAQA